MIRVTARSAASPDRLWSLASDVERWSASPGCPRRSGGDRLATGALLHLGVRPGIRSTAVHTVHDDADGSRLDLSLDWSGPLARALELLLGRKARPWSRPRANTVTRLAEQD
jgi:hypothetical protein